MDFQKINTVPYWSISKDKLLSFFETKEQGLGGEEAQKRLVLFGPNELAKKKRGAFILRFFSKFLNPLILMLLFASLIAGLLGEITNFLIILSIVVFSAIIGFYQEYQAEGAAEKLRKEVSLTATVLRDGLEQEIPLPQVILGDIILLSAGDIVPADARLLSSRDLLVDQASLTGESFPQEKEAEVVLNDSSSVVQRTNSVFMGTNIVSGNGLAVVAKTGQQTEFGKVSQRLVEKRPETDFEKGTKDFGLMITRLTFVLVLFVFLVNTFFKHDILNPLLFSLALAIGLAPELLPIIITINLSRGAVRMAKKKVIVKDLPAIQNFGSMEVLCTDKTGTLTEGRIKLASYEDIEGKEESGVLLFGYLNSVYQSGLKGPLIEAVLDYQPEIDIRDFSKVDEIPFDFKRKRMSVIVTQKDKFSLITNGAPEEVLPICSQYLSDVANQVFSEEKKKLVEKRFKELSSKGLRVLAVAFKNIDNKNKYSKDDEQKLIFSGLLVFTDPPKKTAPEAIQQLEKQGVELKILTGDNELVTQKVCQDINLRVQRTILGNEIDHLSDEALVDLAKKTTIFARVDPEQKERVILALKRGGLVVGFLGDGINDAPSLRAADIGISVDNAVDVAREAADLILLRKDLHVLKDGVYEGRKTHGNVMKYLMMGTSSDFGNMTSLAATSLFLPFLPMLPAQILLNDLLYDVTQLVIPQDHVDQAYTLRPKSWDIKFIKKFMLVFGPISSIFDFLTFFVLFFVFKASSQMFQTGWFVESITTQALIVFSIRTKMTPFYKSRSSLLLLIVSLMVVLVGCLIPLSPLAHLFSFVRLPARFYLILVVLVILYFLLVELTKKWFYKRYEL